MLSALLLLSKAEISSLSFSGVEIYAMFAIPHLLLLVAAPLLLHLHLLRLHLLRLLLLLQAGSSCEVSVVLYSIIREQFKWRSLYPPFIQAV